MVTYGELVLETANWDRQSNILNTNVKCVISRDSDAVYLCDVKVEFTQVLINRHNDSYSNESLYSWLKDKGCSSDNRIGRPWLSHLQ